jgi:predicted RNase H-like HicB family nuclease
MIREYICAAMRKAKYEILADDHSFYGEIAGLAGVYSNSITLEECREELEQVLEEWILLRIHRNLDIPTIVRTRIKMISGKNFLFVY